MLEIAIRRAVSTAIARLERTTPFGSFYLLRHILKGPTDKERKVRIIVMNRLDGDGVLLHSILIGSDVALTLYEQISLKRDVPQDRLRAGDVAILVDIVPGPPGEPQGAVLEVFNAVGESICVTAVSVNDVEPLRADEILSVRTLAKAS
jgi:hypothetical protein